MSLLPAGLSGRVGRSGREAGSGVDKDVWVGHKAGPADRRSASGFGADRRSAGYEGVGRRVGLLFEKRDWEDEAVTPRVRETGRGFRTALPVASFGWLVVWGARPCRVAL